MVFGTQSSNYSVAPIPFREIQLPHKLRLGYYTSGCKLMSIYIQYRPLTMNYDTDNYIKASPSCQRAVLETVEALRKAGHECTEVEVPTGH